MSLFDYLRRRINPPAPVVVSDKPVDRRLRPRGRVPAGSSVLIIDDSKTMLAALGGMLRENQFTVLEAIDGETGLELLRRNTPSLIFLDITLPGLSGFDVLRRIRRSSQYLGKVPVIVMSGNQAATEEYYVRRIGADDFMRKPCSRAEVFSRVEKLLNLLPNALVTITGTTGELLPADAQ